MLRLIDTITGSIAKIGNQIQAYSRIFINPDYHGFANIPPIMAICIHK